MPQTAFFEGLREPGRRIISPREVAAKLDVNLQDIATMARVHRNTVSSHPESPVLQAYLKNLLRVISAAFEVCDDENEALYFVHATPIPLFEHRTAMDMVSEGRTDDVVRYLQSIEAGFVG